GAADADVARPQPALLHPGGAGGARVLELPRARRRSAGGLKEAPQPIDLAHHLARDALDFTVIEPEPAARGAVIDLDFLDARLVENRGALETGEVHDGRMIY